MRTLIRKVKRRNPSVRFVHVGFWDSDHRLICLMRAMKGNPHVTRVCFRFPLSSSNVYNEICSLLRVTKAVQELDIHAGSSNAAFANVLQGVCENKSVRTLTLSGLVGRQGGEMIGEVLLRNQHIAKLDLCDNNLGPDGALCIAQALEKKNSTLTSLRVNRCQFGSEGFLHLYKSLQKNCTLEALLLEHCAEDLRLDCLRELFQVVELSSSLKSLCLEEGEGDTSIDLEGEQTVMDGLAGAIQKNSSLQKLSITLGKLSHADFSPLFRSLTRNDTLQSLELLSPRENRGLCTESVKELARCLPGMRGLRELKFNWSSSCFRKELIYSWDPVLFNDAQNATQHLLRGLEKNTSLVSVTMEGAHHLRARTKWDSWVQKSGFYTFRNRQVQPLLDRSCCSAQKHHHHHVPLALWPHVFARFDEKNPSKQVSLIHHVLCAMPDELMLRNNQNQAPLNCAISQHNGTARKPRKAESTVKAQKVTRQGRLGTRQISCYVGKCMRALWTNQ